MTFTNIATPLEIEEFFASGKGILTFQTDFVDAISSNAAKDFVQYLVESLEPWFSKYKIFIGETLEDEAISDSEEITLEDPSWKFRGPMAITFSRDASDEEENVLSRGFFEDEDHGGMCWDIQTSLPEGIIADIFTQVNFLPQVLCTAENYYFRYLVDSDDITGGEDEDEDETWSGGNGDAGSGGYLGRK